MLDQALIELLEPTIRAIVRREIERERERWRWATVNQAAERLDTSPSAIYSRVHRGQLPHRKLDGRVYIDMQALDAMLDDALP